MSPDPPALDGVVFDLDDTLTDHSGVEAEAWEDIAALVTAAMPGIDPDEVRHRYEANLEPFYARFLAEQIDFDNYQRGRLADAVEPWGVAPASVMDGYLVLKHRMLEEIRPAAGAAAAVGAVRSAGFAVGVLTNGPIDLQRRKLQRIGFESRIDVMLTSEEIGAAKPDRRTFDAIAAALGTKPERLAMIGDSPQNDIEGAIGAGFPAAVLVERGRPRAGGLPRGAIVVDEVAKAPTALGIPTRSE